ncbi:hypothetical protein [Neorhizobium sp. NCHU2750]|uniref:hypothetical protein n=1 Tax=Neorhizobium sp. NCHU2750 TaxID=1825976 RepID=UPI000E71632D|nr:hypothetical protein NCHU2750_27890 [Neorhizobium sp. NCHU2750]
MVPDEEYNPLIELAKALARRQARIDAEEESNGRDRMDGPAGGRGKWSEAGVPKKGWECINVEDLGEPAKRCEMCEAVEIRYVHYMVNTRYDGQLACGVVCAGHMEEDLAGAEVRDKSMRSDAAKRKRFPTLKSWGLSQKQNPTLKKGPFTITVFQRGKYWRAVVNTRGVDKPLYTRDVFSTKEEAQRAAFDTLIVAEQRAKKNRRTAPLADDFDLEF